MGKDKFRKKRKGQNYRPCVKCGGIVNFIIWPEETEARGKKIWHWANEDGSHHMCRNEEIGLDHIRSIINGE